MNKRRAFTILRRVVAGGLAAWTLRQLFVAGTTEALAEGAMRGFLGLTGLLATVLVLSPEFVGWAVVPFHRMIDAVLLPGGSEPPPADYTLPRFYCRQMRYEEACEEYLKIIRYHPRQRLAYLEGIRAAGRAGQPEVAAKIHRLGERAFCGAPTREQLRSALEESRFVVVTDAEEPALLPEGHVPLEASSVEESFPGQTPPPAY